MSTPPEYGNKPNNPHPNSPQGTQGDSIQNVRKFNWLAVMVGVGLAIVLVVLLLMNFRSEKQRVDDPNPRSTEIVTPDPRTQSPDAEAPSNPATP